MQKQKKEMVAIEELKETQGYPKGQIWFRDKSDFFKRLIMKNIQI